MNCTVLYCTVMYSLEQVDGSCLMHFPAGIWALFVRFRTFFGRPRYRRRIRLVALYRMDRFSAPYVNSEAQNFDFSAANYLLRTICRF